MTDSQLGVLVGTALGGVVLLAVFVRVSADMHRLVDVVRLRQQVERHGEAQAAFFRQTQLIVRAEQQVADLAREVEALRADPASAPRRALVVAGRIEP